MRYRHCIFIIVLICTIFPVHLVSASNPYEGKKIEEIEFEGLYKNDVFDIRGVLSTKKGSELDLKLLDEDLKALYNMDLFNNITIEVEEDAEGIVLTYIFDELPYVREIKLMGNKKVRDRAIKDKILIKEDAVFRESELLLDIDSVKLLYKEKGRPDSEVSYEIKEIKEKDRKSGKTYDMVDVTFRIKESGKIIIKTLNLSGVKVVSEKALRRILETRERGYWFSSGHFQDAELELDKDRIEAYYAESGYVDARVIKVDIESQKNEQKKREEMIITLYISEGKQYTYGGSVISGNKIFTEEELFEQITLEDGDVFDKTQWDTGVQNIRNLLSSNGYIYFMMDIEERKDSENLTLSYRITIVENNRAHVENIFVTGNEKTKDFVIKREITIREGEIFNSGKIQRSTERLYALQFFSAVNIDVKPGSELGLIDLIFDVEEQRTGQFSFGITYSTSGRGISFYEEVSENNFLGRGLRLYEKVQIGFTQQIVEFGLDEPWLFNTPTSAGVSFSWVRTTFGRQSGDEVYTFDPNPPSNNFLPDGTQLPKGVIYDDVTGAIIWDDAALMAYTNVVYRLAFRLGRRFGEYYGSSNEISFSVFQNRAATESAEGDPIIPFDEGLREQFYDGYPWNWKNYLKLNIYRDSRDIPFFAKKGSYLGQDVFLYGGLLGGYSNFIRLNTEMNYNVTTFWKFVLALRLNFGFILPYPNQRVIADNTDLLRIDTWNEGRGWSQPSIQWPSLYSLRGHAEMNFSLEYRYPIAERYVWGLVFFDASHLALSSVDNFSLDPKDFWYSFGIGASLIIPGIPIRIYLTRRFKYNYGAAEWQWVNSQYFFRDWDFVLAVAGYF
jgi:outer membrane protein insertion porin family